MKRPENTVKKANVAESTLAKETASVKLGYQAPRVTVLGTAVALVQGHGNSVYQDGRGYYYRG